MERASVADFAFHPDLPAHELDQTGTDGQAQPGAPVFSGSGAVGLRKGRENKLELFGRDAAARIGYAKMQNDRLPDVRFQLHAHPYGTSAGKLDGVTEEVK